MPGGRSSINKSKGTSLNSQRRRISKVKKSKASFEKTVLHGKQGLSAKKQKQMDRAIRNEQRFMASLGMGDGPEEEMTDVVQADPKKARVQVIVPEEVLAAAAAGPGTTLGASA
ncbi:hypothetical protein BC940DRAFT_347501 [Gongronella butleri]|nr:hypothetical protein BC940DRAFT_347501 [Gongronella butleri]